MRMPAQPVTAHLYRPSAGARLFAWLVHAYTATGALFAFAGVIAVIRGEYRTAFLLMVAATVVDATDGVFARMARVKEVTPGFDGARLDDIVDYLTFVFLPVLVLYHAGTLPAGWGWIPASAVLLSSAYGFSSADAKTDDHFFTGFPSYWNIVALYLHAAGLDPVVNGVVLLALAAMVFVRIGYVYPSRTPVLQTVTVVAGVIWSLMIVAIVWLLPDPPGVLVAASLFFPVYYTVLSFVLHARRARA